MGDYCGITDKLVHHGHTWTHHYPQGTDGQLQHWPPPATVLHCAGHNPSARVEMFYAGDYWIKAERTEG